MTSSTEFVWQGWKLIAALDAGTGETGSTFSKAYQWGPDFSNDAGAAGGAGGLLSVRQGGASYFPTYDPMGNITGWLDASGNAAATWDYDAFGRIVAQSGSADSFAFGYATQYTDRESGLVYYGLRYYNPRHGRFINRDPIEEAGGLNLYAFLGNSPGNAWDVLGLDRMICETSSSYDRTLGVDLCRTIPDGLGNAVSRIGDAGRGTPGLGDVAVLPAVQAVIEAVVMMDPFIVLGDPDAGPPAEVLTEWSLRDQLIDAVRTAQTGALGALRWGEWSYRLVAAGGSGGSSASGRASSASGKTETKRNDCYERVDKMLSVTQSDVSFFDRWGSFRNAGQALRDLGHQPQRNEPVIGYRPELVMLGQNADVENHVASAAGAYLTAAGHGLYRSPRTPVFGSLPLPGDIAYAGAIANDGYQFVTDLYDYLTRRDPELLAHSLEAVPEILGNMAGWESGGVLADHIRGDLSTDQARAKLRDVLCE